MARKGSKKTSLTTKSELSLRFSWRDRQRERGEHRCKSISDVRAAPLFSPQLSHVVAVFDVCRLTLASTVVNGSCGRLEGAERATFACQARVTVGGDAW